MSSVLRAQLGLLRGRFVTTNGIIGKRAPGGPGRRENCILSRHSGARRGRRAHHRRSGGEAGTGNSTVWGGGGQRVRRWPEGQGSLFRLPRRATIYRRACGVAAPRASECADGPDTFRPFTDPETNVLWRIGAKKHNVGFIVAGRRIRGRDRKKNCWEQFARTRAGGGGEHQRNRPPGRGGAAFHRR